MAGKNCFGVSPDGVTFAICGTSPNESLVIFAGEPFLGSSAPLTIPFPTGVALPIPFAQIAVSRDAVFAVAKDDRTPVFKFCRTQKGASCTPSSQVGPWTSSGALTNSTGGVIEVNQTEVVGFTACNQQLLLASLTLLRRAVGACGEVVQELPDSSGQGYEFLDDAEVPSFVIGSRRADGRMFNWVVVAFNDAPIAPFPPDYEYYDMLSILGSNLQSDVGFGVPPSDFSTQLFYENTTRPYIPTRSVTCAIYQRPGEVALRIVDVLAIGQTRRGNQQLWKDLATVRNVTCDPSVEGNIMRISRLVAPQSDGSVIVHMLIASTDSATNTSAIFLWSSAPGETPCQSVASASLVVLDIPGIVEDVWLKSISARVSNHSIVRAFVHLSHADESTYIADERRGRVMSWTHVPSNCIIGEGCTADRALCSTADNWCSPGQAVCNSTLSDNAGLCVFPDVACAPTAATSLTGSASSHIQLQASTLLSTLEFSTLAQRMLCIESGIASKRIFVHSVAPAQNQDDMWDLSISAVADSNTFLLQGKSLPTELFPLCEIFGPQCTCAQFGVCCDATILPPPPPVASQEQSAASAGIDILYIALGLGFVCVLIAVGIMTAFCLLRGKNSKLMLSEFNMQGHSTGNTMHASSHDSMAISHDEFELLLVSAGGDKDSFIDGVDVGERIGGGNFGAVYKGLWRGTTPVALKELKDAAEAQAFAAEAALLCKLNHPKIVKYLGIFAAPDNRRFITIEFMDEGSVRDLLLKTDCSSLQLLKLASDAAAGMVYLSAEGIVHRDLALRNLLAGQAGTFVNYQGESLGMSYVAKVADFGLSREIGAEESDYYLTSDREIPVKWTAPEALSSGRFSSRSDVWSFAVMMSELFSGAGVPYAGLTNAQCTERVRAGYRMPIMEFCPENIYQLLLRCWAENPEQRPTFQEIFQWIEYAFQNEAKAVGLAEERPF